MSPFFASVHNAESVPLFQIGSPASSALRSLAEFGDPSPLVSMYLNAAGILSAKVATLELLFGGQSLSFPVMMTMDHPYVSFATMALNTNDCFVGSAGIMVKDGMDFFLVELDAGTEENNELCSSIPGPACLGTTNVESGNGEGVVQLHRGISGIGDLLPFVYDWRNPMGGVTVTRV